MKIVYFLLITLGLIISACATSGAGGGEIPIPSKWKLESFGKAGAAAPVVTGSTVKLEFLEDGQLGGSGGCNSYGAKYEIDGTNLSIKELVSTLMACVDEKVMQQETLYFTALQSASSFEISGDKLTIFYGDGANQLNFVTQ
ncbi:MAG: hypothetical protein A2136_10950 [Chloroflexi bacterium RBG_16_54_11]|nr:MAG: hypothetical protein A2136_10950 [Chloroflexi bacterium RBG_16_54_11]